MTLAELRDNCNIRGNGCWMWKGAKDTTGYGVVRDGERIRQAHIRAYELKHGKTLPDGVVLDHLCNHRACINPAHLKRTDQQGNIERAGARGVMARDASQQS